MGTLVNFLKMTQAELAESVFAKLAVDAEFIPESDETMELGTYFNIYANILLNFNL